MQPTKLRLRANYYQQFDADHARDVPAEGYGGWKAGDIEIDADRTALVLMHAWDCGTYEQHPGWWKCCDEIPRTYKVCREVLPPLLGAIRRTALPLFHVVDGGDYYKKLPGYRRTLALAGAGEPAVDRVERDAGYWALKNFQRDNAFPGKHNLADINAGAPGMNFPKEARPLDRENIAENTRQLLALCKAAGVNHLIYMGFNIDWCLLMSPGGMLDMSRHGVMCSALRQAVTAVENKETARRELCKEIGLWRVSVQFGFVFDVPDFVSAIDTLPARDVSSTPGPSGRASDSSSTQINADLPGAPVSTPLAQSWIEHQGETFGAKPDETGPIGGGAGYTRVVTNGDFTVSTLAELLAALAQAKAGQTVFIKGDAEIDLTDHVFCSEKPALVVPAGVTLAGDRGHKGSPGALLRSDAHQTSPLLEIAGAGVRVTGLRLRGPDPERRLQWHHDVFFAKRETTDDERAKLYYKLPNSDAITVDADRLEVDNCEISAWSHAGVYLRHGHDHHIHHNFIHHVQRMGLGYGVCHNFDSRSLIEFNLFQDNKHHIAGTGSPGQRYEARHNIVLPYTESHLFNGKPYGQDHLFDLHGGRDREDGTTIAGEALSVHHNTFMSDYMAVCIRGIPEQSADIHHNWLYALKPAHRGQFWSGSTHDRSPGPNECTVMSDGRTTVHDNAYGRPGATRVGLDPKK